MGLVVDEVKKKPVEEVHWSEVAGTIERSGQEPVLAKMVEAVKGLVAGAMGKDTGATVAAAEMGMLEVKAVKADKAMARMEGSKLVGQVSIPVKDGVGSKLAAQASIPAMKEAGEEESKQAEMGSIPAMEETGE